MLSVMQAVDAAELRGDALGAIHAINAHPCGPDGKPFWRLERLRRLSQLVALEGLLPRWAISRWILAQAAQHLDPPNRGRNARAMHVALRAQPPGPAGMSQRDQEERRVRIQDRDWIFRQVLLFEQGGLDHFLHEVAPADLLAGADRVEEWARAPIGAFRFLAGTAGMLRWRRLDSGETVETIDIGSATLLRPGDCVIGRLVPIDEGAMFESAPLRVPEAAALRIAEEPGCWVEVVAAAARQQDADGNAACYTGGHDFGLLTDVPVIVQHMLHVAAADRRGEVPDRITPDAMREMAVAYVRDAIDGRLDDVGDDAEGGEDATSPWPTVAAALLDNAVRAAVGATSAPADAARLSKLAQRLAGPAVTVCGLLAAGPAEAA